MTELPSINLVLLFRNPQVSEVLGPALWAALMEVETFYNDGEQRANFHRFYMSDQAPGPLEPETKGVPGLDPLATMLSNVGLAKKKGKVTVSPNQWIAGPGTNLDTFAESKYTDMYEAHKIALLVESMLREHAHTGRVVVVTDVELVPPGKYRYIIWRDGVISTAPTDPEYWGMLDANRISVLKHRVRSVLLCSVGVLLGLRRCDDELCFLFGNIDSVLRLDGMVKLAAHHGLPALVDRGFEVVTNDPSATQPITDHPEPRRWFYER